tara:strand:- start:385 stop:645 length:261 start_codon:yes stop_codon:yes gene_type:complete
MFSCVLCERETCYFAKFCDKCRRIKHYINLYGDRPIEILDNVLSRDIEKQSNKEKVEIEKEIETKKYNLREKKINKKSRVELDQVD